VKPRKSWPLPLSGLNKVQARKAWLKARGIRLQDIARVWGTHWTYPGKCLFGSERMTEERKRQLQEAFGFPEHLL